MKFSAKWIWKQQKPRVPYNQTVVARKRFKLVAFDRGILRITADSYYRLYVNGIWIADGPCRSWTEHFRYDELDVTFALRSGENEIEIISTFFGVGVLTRQVKEAGLLAQLDVTQGSKRAATVVTDGSWEVAEAKAWTQSTPKISLNMEAHEQYDARREKSLRFSPAQELCEAHAGPWKNLQPRDVALMTKEPFAFKSFLGAKLVKAEGLQFCLPVTRLTHPGVIEANAKTSMFCGMATMLVLEKKTTVEIQTEGFRAAVGTGFRVSVNGKSNASGRYVLGAGKHLLLAFTDGLPDHHGKEKVLRILKPLDVALENPLKADHKNPWCFIPFDEFRFAKDDLDYFLPQDHDRDPEIKTCREGYHAEIARLLKCVADLESFQKELGKRAKCLPADKMFCNDVHWKFPRRTVVGSADKLVEAPDALLFDHQAFTTVHPSPKGDVELCYDLGEQNCGYYNFELIAEEGGSIDIAGIEHIEPDGELDHTGYYKNSLHYVTKAGANRFTSLKRRSGRFVFVTLRGFKKPVKIRHVNLIESTYPVNPIGSFCCSDETLNNIWEISNRTLKLCMEDAFTDCPLYEQTLWVGDARNEALFAYPVFGATDIGKRCIRLAAQMPDSSPLVACQCPNDWVVHLPAWSFLWGISVWDYYWYSGDAAFVEEIFPAVIENIRGGESLLSKERLFSGPFWNMFDWSGADQDQDTVLHNTMFLVGAIDAALKCARAIGDKQHGSWLRGLRKRLVYAVNALWDDKKKAYPDSIRNDGTISPSICTHTSFLSILYDIVEEKNYDAALKNVLAPPKGMVGIGSPFAFLYLYETLEKVGCDQDILDSIYQYYIPMVERGETTVTERLGIDNDHRSRAHAWSSSPSYFLPRIVLGIKQTAAGGKAFEVSPLLSDLSWAEGSIATPHGAVQVKWEIIGRQLKVAITAPSGVKVKFKANESHRGLNAVVAASAAQSSFHARGNDGALPSKI